MKYFKKQQQIKNKYIFVLFFIVIISFSIFSVRDILFRSIYNVTLANYYIEFLNEKAELINFIKKNKLNTVELKMSSNNYVRMQKERAKMTSNYILTGENSKNLNNYYPIKIKDTSSNSKGEIKLFGMNVDHFRDSGGHSFRIKFNGGSGYGNQKFNFVNPRSRNFTTDALINLIFKKVYKGIQINYEPVNVILNKIKYGILYKEDFFDKYLIENNERRESVIFEIIGDSIHFNHLGKNDVFRPIANEIKSEYLNNYDLFLEKIDINLVKPIIVLASIINSSHPLISFNLHWYFNPVTGLYEPTFREGFASSIDEFSTFKIEKFIFKKNVIFEDLYKLKLNKNFNNYFNNQLNKIDSFIKHDNDYKNLKLIVRKKLLFKTSIYLKLN